VSLHRTVTGAGPDLVLLHGLGTNGALFDALAAPLATGCRVHALDLPGHGRSPWVRGAGDLEGMARRVAEHLPERCSVLGWSLGGMVATRIATRFPERIEALVLVATTPRFIAGRDWAHGVAPALHAGLVRAFARDPAGALREFASLVAKSEAQPLEALRELKRALGAAPPPSGAALAAALEILRTADLRAELPRVAAATLVLCGEGDRLTPPGAARALAALVPNAQLGLLADTGHVPVVSLARDVAARVARFLEAAR
jgi:pimeloyl-[acyl-carrier protein] methyl ester esterase